MPRVPHIRTLFLLFIFCCWRGFGSIVKREADYTLDDSFWKEDDNGKGEVERLLQEHKRNQEMVRSIGSHYYQVIYPVQLRHHEKISISTREIGSAKFPNRGHSEGGNYGRGKSRAGKHFHRTSLLIKAFNHKFRLDLELNAQLLAPNLVQKHYFENGAEQTVTQEIEHCYYHGTVKDYPGATAAFHTCQGVSGIIHLGNETFVIHPFYGGDLSKHPHVIFEAQTKPNKGCANSAREGRLKSLRKSKRISLVADDDDDDDDDVESDTNGARYRRDVHKRTAHANYSKIDRVLTSDFFSMFDNVRVKSANRRSPRDVRETTKYIEAAIVLDKAMFEKRNGSTRTEVVHDAIQVANIADLYFKQVNTRVAVVYIETWQGRNRVDIDRDQDIHRALLSFNDYTTRNMFKITKDTTQLLTGEPFSGEEVGEGAFKTVCTGKSVGISVDLNPYEPHILGGTMAHMIGHNLGMSHDDENCVCRDWHGCIMAQNIVGLSNVQPYRFSECSNRDYVATLKDGDGMCLINKPNEFTSRHRNCGNGIVEEGEACDCGGIEDCREKDPCCDPITCKLNSEAECATGPCCEGCRLKDITTICREATSECDIVERCDGENGQCPPDLYKKNGTPCGENGQCFQGICPTMDSQCQEIWGYGGKAADIKCFEQFNSKGSINGHCGTDVKGNFIKCDQENALCGSLQCQNGRNFPKNKNHDFARTSIFNQGEEYECKALTVSKTPKSGDSIPNRGLVLDGTSCGPDMICVNQTCVKSISFINTSRCPSNQLNVECSGEGECSQINKCSCNLGWRGADCSIEFKVEVPPSPSPGPPIPPVPTSDTASQMKKIDTPYENYHATNTAFLVGMLMSVVGGVFVLFALMALCYRRKSTMQNYELPYVKKPMLKKTSSASASEEAGIDSVNKILTFGTTPSYSRGDSQRVLFRPVNHTQPGMVNARVIDHKGQQPVKRPGINSASEDDPMISGEEESVAFIDLPPNNLSKLPEKGILKKPGPYSSLLDSKEKWSEDSQSDNQETLSQSDNNLGESSRSGGTISDVERTLKSLNGYHEDILEALRTAAASHSSSSHRPPGGLGMHTPSGSSSLLSEEILRKSLIDAAVYNKSSRGSRGGSQEKICDHSQTHTVLVDAHRRQDDEEDDLPPSCGPIRIRNLEDLIRQLEHHSARHMSPSGSEDIRMSETEADRHYRLETSDSQGTRKLYL